MKIYTKTGDKGTTGLFGGKRVDKDDIRIEAYGTVDELNSFIGHLIALAEASKTLNTIQHRLFTIGSSLASDPNKSLITPDILESDIQLLEHEIDQMNESLPPLRAFILPGGSQSVAIAHQCRTITRRSERRVISLSKVSNIDPLIIQYLNRLSDYFFVYARFLAKEEGVEEVEWHPRSK
jgi:cob(I)alamin adenosyltransferase